MSSTEYIECPACDGAGSIAAMHVDQHGNEIAPTVTRCPACLGVGRILVPRGAGR
jgi:DnaJ-class molecular chaperone